MIAITIVSNREVLHGHPFYLLIAHNIVNKTLKLSFENLRPAIFFNFHYRVIHCNIPPDSGHEVTTKLLLKHNLTHAHSGTIDILHPPFLERGNLYTDTKKIQKY